MLTGRVALLADGPDVFGPSVRIVAVEAENLTAALLEPVRRVVDLEALKNSIVNGQVSGAAIDVYPWEPEKNGDKFQTPLQNIPNVILTPHIGGSTEEAQEIVGEALKATPVG